MFSTKKKIAALGVSAVAVASAGIAGAYWTTTGSGSGVGDTTAGVEDQLVFTQDTLNAMYPGDSSQPLVVEVKNNSTESAYVASVKAYITTSDAGCTGADFLLAGNAAPSTAGTAVDLTWTAKDMPAGSSDDAISTIKFNNTTSNQDACKDVDVTIHYLAS
jgi:hypothetical protein